jgi:acyl-CoA thioester hydrolase
MCEYQQLLEGYPVVITIPVLWGDEDAFGHVNNITYLRWCEAARIDYLCRVSFFPPLPPKGLAPILASVKCDYKMAVKYPDTVHVGARVTRIGNSSFQMEHSIISGNFGKLAAHIDSILVVLDYSLNRPARVPDEVRKTIGEVEGRVF